MEALLKEARLLQLAKRQPDHVIVRCDMTFAAERSGELGNASAAIAMLPDGSGGSRDGVAAWIDPFLDSSVELLSGSSSRG